MVKLKHTISDEDRKKISGYFLAKVEDIQAEEKKSAKGKEYTLLTLDLKLKDGPDKKIFFRIPWDNWEQQNGKKTLFQQFREATDLNIEELGDTKNYKGQKFGVIVGPEKTWDETGWQTFEANNGSTMLSYNVIMIISKNASEDQIKILEKENIETIKMARKYMGIDQQKESGSEKDVPGFSNTNPTDDDDF